jgi:hypothetical protein
MKLKIKATLSQRTRIPIPTSKHPWFTVAGPWHHTPIDQAFDLPNDQQVTFNVANVPVSLKLTVYRNPLWVTLEVSGFGYSLGHINAKASGGDTPASFRVEPIKGVILEGVISAEA